MEWDVEKFHTKRFIKGLAEFKVRLMNIVKLESQEYLDKATYRHDVTISKSVLKDGLAYSKVKHIVHREESNNIVVAYMLHGEVGEIFDQTDVDGFLNAKYKTFDDWANNMSRFYIITFDNDPANWKKSHCTCPAFARFYICKHTLYIAYKLGLIKEKKNKYLAPNAPKGP